MSHAFPSDVVIAKINTIGDLPKKTPAVVVECREIDNEIQADRYLDPLRTRQGPGEINEDIGEKRILCHK
jgi:hypothetical protein